MRNLFVIFGLIFSSLSCIDPPPAAVAVGEPDQGPDLGFNNSSDMASCVPEDNRTFCERNDADCGPFNGVDNCGDMRSSSCGSCPVGECGEDNKCEAVRAICAMRDADCGTILLDQGGEGNCGTCEAPDTCGGAGTANKCGCTDVADACGSRMIECGGIEVLRCDGEKEVVDCGMCPTNLPICVEGGCRCIPEVKEAFCERIGKCGSVEEADNCGNQRTEDCGCEDGEVCKVDSCCVPQSDGELCQIRNSGPDPSMCVSVATVTDNCGQERDITCNCLCELNTGGPQECDGRCGDFIDDDGCNKTCPESCPESMVCDPMNVCCEPVQIAGFCAGRCGQVTKTDNCGVSHTRDCGGCPLLNVCSNTRCYGI